MSELANHLKRSKGEGKRASPVYEKVKKEWLETLRGLFGDIRRWIAVEERAGLLSLREEVVDRNEYRLGRYSAPSLRIMMPNDEIRIIPVARYVVGARGRVDLISNVDSAMLLHSSKKRWGITDRTMREQMPLNKTTFGKWLIKMTS